MAHQKDTEQRRGIHRLFSNHYPLRDQPQICAYYRMKSRMKSSHLSAGDIYKSSKNVLTPALQPLKCNIVRRKHTVVESVRTRQLFESCVTSTSFISGARQGWKLTISNDGATNKQFEKEKNEQRSRRSMIKK